MGTTYVYLTTKVDDTVQLAMTFLGPKDLQGTKLTRTSLGKSEKKKEVMSVPRIISIGMYILDTSLSIGGDYVASLELMLRGHSPGSMIWWRWRVATENVGYWITDHKSHRVDINARGRVYHFTVTGKGAIGYDDVEIELTV